VCCEDRSHTASAKLTLDGVAVFRRSSWSVIEYKTQQKSRIGELQECSDYYRVEKQTPNKPHHSLRTTYRCNYSLPDRALQNVDVGSNGRPF